MAFLRLNNRLINLDHVVNISANGAITEHHIDDGKNYPTKFFIYLDNREKPLIISEKWKNTKEDFWILKDYLMNKVIADNDSLSKRAGSILEKW